MLNGIHIYVEGNELADHLKERAVHHKTRREANIQKLADVRKRIEDLEKMLSAAQKAAVAAVVASVGSSFSTGPVDPAYSLRAAENTYKEAVNSHGRKAALFEFMSVHIPTKETFDLTENDLTRLELLDKYSL